MPKSSEGGGRSTSSDGVVVLEGSGRRALYPVCIGVIDDRAVRAFTGGQCHALALALHERTGWPLAWVVDGEGEPKHCYVVDGHSPIRALDIAGLHSRRELVHRWGEAEELVDPRHLIALSTGFAGWRAPRLDVARAFLDEVLVMHSRQVELYPPGPDSVPDTDEPTPTPPYFLLTGRDGRVHRLRPGVLDDATRRVLESEQSYAVAVYLAHELPGGPWRVGLVEDLGRLRAFAVSEVAGIAVDARGTRGLSDLPGMELPTLKSIAARFGAASYPTADYAVGEHYARLVLSECSRRAGPDQH